MSDARLRQFSLTGGRARAESELPLEVPLTAVGVAAGALMPEQRAVLRLCEAPQTVVDLSAALRVPVGVIRVVALDLADRGLLRVHLPTARGGGAVLPPHRDLELLEEALHGIAAL